MTIIAGKLVQTDINLVSLWIIVKYWIKSATFNNHLRADTNQLYHFSCLCNSTILLIMKRREGRAIAQAVSHCLPTSAARVRARVWSSGICGGKSGAGTGFLLVLWFPLPIFTNLHSTKFSIIIITRGRYNRPFSGRRAEWTQLGLHPPLCELKKKKRREEKKREQMNGWAVT
jgi:hypothetical protein